MRYVTGKKELITEYLSKNADASFTLEEICDAVVKDGGGKSTVYRLVSELVNDGCVRRLTDGHTRHVTYQYIGDEHCHGHLHLKCKGCGKLIHLDEELSRELEGKVRSLGGFVIEEGTLLFGTCLGCAEVRR